jgi:hypothetical protein
VTREALCKAEVRSTRGLKRCPACRSAVYTAELDWHRKEDCPRRSVRCGLCRAEMPAKDLQSHRLEICAKAKAYCVWCGDRVLRSLHERHSLSCEANSWTCPGCEKRWRSFKSRLDERRFVWQHLESCPSAVKCAFCGVVTSSSARVGSHRCRRSKPSRYGSGEVGGGLPGLGKRR